MLSVITLITPITPITLINIIQSSTFFIPYLMNNEISFHPATLVDKSMQNTGNYYLNPLFEWMCLLASYTTAFMHLLPIFQRYKVGVTSNNEVIYWQHDLQGNCRGGKIMKYLSNGHRDKQYGAKWVHSALNLHDFNLCQVPFGLHLLPSFPSNCTIAVVESEKTALLAAAYNVVYLNNENRLPLFIATGGAGNLNNTLKYLKGRKVVIFPDEDQTIAWAKIASKHASSFRSLSIDSTVRQAVIDGILPPKSDLGDLLAIRQQYICQQ